MIVTLDLSSIGLVSGEQKDLLEPLIGDVLTQRKSYDEYYISGTFECDICIENIVRLSTKFLVTVENECISLNDTF